MNQSTPSRPKSGSAFYELVLGIGSARETYILPAGTTVEDAARWAQVYIRVHPHTIIAAQPQPDGTVFLRVYDVPMGLDSRPSPGPRPGHRGGNDR